MDNIARAHKDRFHGSGLGCPRQMALKKLGYKSKVSKKLAQIFEIGHEIDEVMKEEAVEEFGEDFTSPETKLLSFKAKDGTVAKVAVTPDGLLPNELLEFKGLSSNNSNAVKTEEDLRDGAPLFQKYYNQVQFYAGIFKKDKIRFRIKNKRNMKNKDIVFAADPVYYKKLKGMVLDTQRIMDRGQLPPVNCNAQERKFCRLSTICKKMEISQYADVKEEEFNKTESKKLLRLASESRALKLQIDELEVARSDITDALKELMRTHGKRQEQVGDYVVKYGIRYREIKDKEVIANLVEKGMIPTTEEPAEYLEVRE